MIGILPFFVYLKKTMYKNTFKPNTKQRNLSHEICLHQEERNGASAH